MCVRVHACVCACVCARACVRVRALCHIQTEISIKLFDTGTVLEVIVGAEACPCVTRKFSFSCNAFLSTYSGELEVSVCVWST